MRSALAPILSRRPWAALPVAPDETPVSYTRRSTVSFPLLDSTTTDSQLRTFESIPALFACVSELAEATGQVEWCLYRSAPSGVDEDRVEITNAAGGHAALDQWEQPNPYMDRTFFVTLAQMHMELAGEAFLVIGTDRRAPGLPLSLWPVIPSMMTVVPHPTKFLAGYVYNSPDGERVPFQPDEVIHLKYPNPRDPYRGLSPVTALMTELDATRFASEWNRNFFLNSAEPGGIIEIADSIEDDEFDELAARWADQHQGVGNSHRVAILTNGMKWVDRSFSMRDLQFAELQRVSDERIMLGYRMGKTLLGQTEGVNRATAEAAEYVFGKYRVVRRLNRWRSIWNRRLLPMFANGRLLEMDYENPVTANVEEEAKDRDSRVGAVVALIGAGFDPLSAVEAFDLPELELAPEKPPPPLPPLGQSPPGPGQPGQLPPGPGPGQMTGDMGEMGTGTQPADHAHHHHHHPHRLPVRARNAATDPPAELPPDQLPDVTRLQDTFDRLLAQLLTDWAELEQAQKDDLVAQVRHIAANGSIDDLATLSVDTARTAALLARVMTEAGVDAADAVVDEADTQGVTIQPGKVDSKRIDGVSTVVSGLVAARLVASAASTAMRANGPHVTPADVAGKVREGLDGLSVDGPRPQLAGAITGSQNEARIATLRKAPEGAIYASEVNDSNTCSNCAAVDGKWLGNVSDLDEIEQLYPGGAYGGYVDCLGRERCRGTIVGVWRSGPEEG